MMKRTLLSFFAFILSAAAFAQGNDVEMADTMRSNGKIYVVAAVAFAILIAIFLYLIRLDKKLSRLEKETKNHH